MWNIFNFLKGNKDKNFEIERKFLLKRVPNSSTKKPDYVYTIYQYYFIDTDGKEKRIREQRSDETNIVKYILTEKKYIKKGICEEYENEISEEMFYSLKEKSHKRIAKVRYIYKVSDNLKWEIDEYLDINMVTAEIELPSLKTQVQIPNFINELIIKEVTGEKVFSNSNLANKYEHF